jgi:hypothetical protein
MAIGHWLAFELTVVIRCELTVAGSTSTNVVST